MSFKVFIPTAGLGTRLANATKHLNKSLIPVDFKPAISHIIEKFPTECHFVIALGYKGNLVRDYLDLCYPNKKITYKYISNFKGKGSGLGLTLLECQEHLNEPFVFVSCDTLVMEPIPYPNRNWIGFSNAIDIQNYRTIKINNQKKVIQINEKGKNLSLNSKAYIGLSGIKDYNFFWDCMKYGKKNAIRLGEAFAIAKMIHKSSFSSKEFNWFDVGNTDSLYKTRSHLKSLNYQILEKENESIWFIKNKVIKFSTDKQFINQRVLRSKLIKDFIPEITKSNTNMYSYKKVNGQILSDCINKPLFIKLLKHSKKFWKKTLLKSNENKKFQNICDKFYRLKTLERIDLFYKIYNKTDQENLINGEQIPTLKKLLNKVNWKDLSTGIPVRFHGDYHFENILLSNNNKFVFLDWRQNFGGILEYGDIYYDLAKLLHGLIINHKIINQNLFNITWNKKNITYDFKRNHILVECEDYLSKWTTKNNLDYKKIKIITSLIYLNIAALHHHPYSLLLYCLGKKMLYDEVVKNDRIL